MRKIKKILSFVIVLSFMLSISAGALAAEYNIANGDIAVHAGEAGQTVTQGGTTAPDAAPVITGSGSNTVTISSDSGHTAEVTFSGVNIATPTDESGVTITDGSSAVINIEGSSYIVNNAPRTEADAPEKAIIHIGDGSSLTLTSEDYAYLKVSDDYGSNSSAAIGSDADEDFTGSLTVSGELCIQAESGSDGAAIGAGENGDFVGAVTVTGGADIFAISGGDGAGIGAGEYGDFSGEVIVSGKAYVSASSHEDAAGIGSGEHGEFSGSVSISDKANVGSMSYEGGAGIGSGAYGDFSGAVNISSENVVQGQSNGNGAGIGSGLEADFNGSINIEGAEVYGNSNAPSDSPEYGQGAGIGSGAGGDDIVISPDFARSLAPQPYYLLSELAAKLK